MGEEKKSQTLARVKVGAHSMMAYMIALGASNREVAEKTGYTEHRISEIRNSPAFIKEVEKIQERYFAKDVGLKFKQIAPEAVKVTEDIMRDESIKPAIRLQAAQAILDRGVGRPQQTIEIGGSLLRSIFEKLDKMESDKIIDIGPEDPIDKWVKDHL